MHSKSKESIFFKLIISTASFQSYSTFSLTSTPLDFNRDTNRLLRYVERSVSRQVLILKKSYFESDIPWDETQKVGCKACLWTAKLM